MLVYTVEWCFTGFPNVLRYMAETGKNISSYPVAKALVYAGKGKPAFVECVGILLSAGWAPGGTFLRDCVAKMAAKVDERPVCYEIFCRLVEVYHADGRLVPADMLHTVIPLIIKGGVGANDPSPETIIARLIAAGCPVDETAMKLAMDGKLWGCVAKIAEAM
jgi:hypothetical protein